MPTERQALSRKMLEPFELSDTQAASLQTIRDRQELAAARERLQRWRLGNEGIHVVYADFEDPTRQMGNDSQLCLDALLAQPDDTAKDAEIAEEWLREIGFDELFEQWKIWRLPVGELLIELDRWPPTGGWRVFAVRGGLSVLLLIPATTRRQLLDLLSGLGVPANAH